MSQESLSSEIRLDDDDPDAVQGLLEYIYTFQYPQPIEVSDDLSNSSINKQILRSSLQNLKIHSLAQKYLLFTLRDMAKDRILQQISALPADDEDKLHGYFTFLSEVYNLPAPGPLSSNDTSGVQELRSAVSETIIGDWDWMVEQQQLLGMLEEMPDLALEVMKSFRKKIRGAEEDRKSKDRMIKSWGGGEEVARVGGYGTPNCVQYGYY